MCLCVDVTGNTGPRPVCVCVCVCVRACVRACLRAYLRACMCVRAYVLSGLGCTT